MDVYPPSNVLLELKCLKAQAMGGAASKGASDGKVGFHFAWEFCHILLLKSYLWRLCFFRFICNIFFSPPLWTASYNMCAGLHFHIIELKPFPLQGRIWLS